MTFSAFSLEANMWMYCIVYNVSKMIFKFQSNVSFCSVDNSLPYITRKHGEEVQSIKTFVSDHAFYLCTSLRCLSVSDTVH